MFRKAKVVSFAVALLWAIRGFAAAFPLDYFAARGIEDQVNLLRDVEKNHIYGNHLGKTIFELISSGNYSQAYLEMYYVLDRIPNHPEALRTLGSLARLTN